MFDALYSRPIRKALSERNSLDSAKAIDILLSSISKGITEYSDTDRDYCHVSALKQYKSFFEKTTSLSICLMCCVAMCEVHLPCGCAICETCCSVLSDESRLLELIDCPLCCREWDISYKIRLPPVTAGPRILALDGGGVRGIVQLTVLAHVSKKLGIKLRAFFDLVVGTSAGKFPLMASGIINLPTL